jgi:hypothetical protein
LILGTSTILKAVDLERDPPSLVSTTG